MGAVALRAPRRHRRRVVRSLSVVLIVAGALLLVDVLVTVLWQEPVSALFTTLRQQSLASNLGTLERLAPSAAEARALNRLSDEQARIVYLAGQESRTVGEGQAIGRIVIPRLHVDFVMVAGTSTSDLEGGPGLYQQTRFPGVPGTTAIAGHRTTFLAPFRHIDELTAGDQIILQMPYANLVYTTVGTHVVAPADVGVVSENGTSRLVLSACTPLFSAADRIVAVAQLTQEIPRGAALS
jgi:sortase A